MPTYNRAAYIGAAVASVQNQTYSNWELIIIDDGSDDNTAAIVEQLHDDRISFFKAGRIGIGGKIKNIGLKKATGTLIAFIDSDDLWHDTKLAKQVAALQQYPAAGFSITGGYNFSIPGTPAEFFYGQRDGELHTNIFNLIFASKIAMFTQALLLRKTCLLQSGFFKEAGSFSDFDFIANLAFYHTAVVLYEPLFFRRLHNSNYIGSTWEKSYYEGMASILCFKNENKLQPALARDALFRLLVHFGNDALHYNKKRLAVVNFFKAWRYKPISIVPFKKIAKAIVFSKKVKQ